MFCIKSLWHRLNAMDLQRSHTAIAFHWDGGVRPDVTFMLKGLLRGEPLHTALDALLEEHAYHPNCDTITEVTIFWHTSDGQWECEEIVSHYCCKTA